MLQENLKPRAGLGCSGSAGDWWGDYAASLTQESLPKKHQAKDATAPLAQSI